MRGPLANRVPLDHDEEIEEFSATVFWRGGFCDEASGESVENLHPLLKPEVSSNPRGAGRAVVAHRRVNDMARIGQSAQGLRASQRVERASAHGLFDEVGIPIDDRRHGRDRAECLVDLLAEELDIRFVLRLPAPVQDAADRFLDDLFLALLRSSSSSRRKTGKSRTTVSQTIPASTPKYS